MRRRDFLRSSAIAGAVVLGSPLAARPPRGCQHWVVNRVTSNAQVIDPRTRSVIAEIPFVGKTPDIVAMSPDSRFAFITLRGPNPVTMPPSGWVRRRASRFSM